MRCQSAEIKQPRAPSMHVQLFVNTSPVMQVGVLMQIAVVNTPFRLLFDSNRIADSAQRAVLTANLKPVDALVVSDDILRDVMQ